MLVFFLPVNNAQEIVTLSLGLLSHHLLAFHELSAAGNIQILGLFLRDFTLNNLLSAMLAISFFTGTLSTQRIDFRLSVGSFFLHFAETSYFSLLLKSNTALFGSLRGLFGKLFLVVTVDLVFLIKLLLAKLRPLAEGYLVGCLNLGNHPLVALPKDLSLSDLFFLLLLDIALHLLLLPDRLIALLDTRLLAFLDLVDDHGSTLALGLLAFNFALLRDL